MGSRNKRKQQKRRNDARKRLEGRHEEDPLIGYVATTGTNMVCKGTACIVAGSKEQMARFVQDTCGVDRTLVRIEPARFLHIVWGYSQGGAYAFDQTAYRRFYDPGCKMGLPLPKPNFSNTDPSQVELVTIFRKDLPQGW